MERGEKNATLESIEKIASAMNVSLGLDRRTGKWYAYINFQKKHYNLGLHKDKSAAIRARRAAEARLHDPVILEYWDSLTEKRKKEFQDYLRSTNK